LVTAPAKPIHRSAELPSLGWGADQTAKPQEIGPEKAPDMQKAT